MSMEHRSLLASYAKTLETSGSAIEMQRAIDAATLIAAKFAIEDLKAVIRSLEKGKPRTWPLKGDLAGRLKDAAVKRLESSRGKPAAGFQNINGWGYDQIMSTREGRRALAAGKLYTFLMDVKRGEVPVESLSFPEGMQPRE